MKKLLIIICSLLLVTSCSEGVANVSDENKVLVTVGDKDITKKDNYDLLMATGSGYMAISKATEYILDQEVEVTDELMQEAKDQLALYKASYGESFNEFIAQYGFKDEDDYLNNSILMTLRLKELTTMYAKEHVDEFIKEEKPVKVTYAGVSSKEDAEKALADLKNGVSITEITSNYNATNTADSSIKTNTSSIDQALLDTIYQAKENGYLDILQIDNTYYAIRIDELDANNMLDEVTEYYMMKAEVSKASDLFYFNKYNFSIHDLALYENISTNYPDYIE